MPNNPQEVAAALARAKANAVQAAIARAHANAQAGPAPEQVPPQGAPQGTPTPDQYAPVVGQPRAEGRGINAPATTDTPMDTAKDAAVGAGTGASLGFDDEIAGAVTPGVAYQKARDDYRARKALAESRSPVANAVGQGAGQIATTAATGGLGAGGRLAAGTALRGAVEGAAQGAGNTDVQGIAGPSAYAAPVVGGAVAGGAMSKLAGSGAKRLAPAAGAGGEIRQALPEATRAADRARVASAGMPPHIIAEEPGGVAGHAEALRAAGVGTGLFHSPEQMEAQAMGHLSKIRELRQAVVHAADSEKIQISGQQVALALRRQAQALHGETDTILARKAALEKTAARYEQDNRSLSFRQLNEHRAGYGKGGNFGMNVDPGVNEAAHKAVNEVMQSALNERVPQLGDKWRKLGQQDQRIQNALSGIQARLGRNAMNQNPSAQAQAMGALGAIKSGPQGVVMAAANHAIRQGQGIRAAVKERAVKGIQGAAETADTRSSALQATSMGRALQHSAMPASSLLARTAGAHVTRSMNADASAEAVQQASPEDQARVHFIESQTNPAYRQDIARPGEAP